MILIRNVPAASVRGQVAVACVSATLIATVQAGNTAITAPVRTVAWQTATEAWVRAVSRITNARLINVSKTCVFADETQTVRVLKNVKHRSMQKTIAGKGNA